MLSCNPPTLNRRQFLRTAGGLVAGTFGAVVARADELPKNTNPRAISGDTVEPDWRQRLSITVGPKKADLVGAADRVIRAAVDYVSRLGGGGHGRRGPPKGWAIDPPLRAGGSRFTGFPQDSSANSGYNDSCPVWPVICP